jgi:hypothetical protein
VLPIVAEQFTVDRREGGAVAPVTAFDPEPAGLLLGVGIRASIP